MEMEIKVRPAGLEEYTQVMEFYDRVTDEMEGREYHPAWQKGVYPDPAFIRRSAQEGTLYVLEADGIIAGAMVMNHETAEGYDRVPWQVEARPEEVAVLHALGVLPGYHGHGLGKKLVGAAAGLASQAGCRAIRLDVLEGNLPARWLYERMGFHYICRTELFYEDTGRMGFWMYELALGEGTRPAEPEDWKIVYDLMCQLENQELPKEGFHQIYMEQQKDEHFWQSVYVLDGQVKGFVNMRMEGQLHHGGPVAEILELIVDGSARGRGIGAVLFREACAAAWEKGCMCLDVTSGQQRTGAHRFYLREGMKKSHFKFTMEPGDALARSTEREEMDR